VGPMITAPPRIPGLAEWRPLARGGFSTVWQAKQESLNRLVAVKVDERTLDSESDQRRFLREAGAAGRLSGHPGIVTVHDAGILGDDRPYLVMELCPGGAVSAWLKEENRPSQERVREVGVRIADALAAAHARGVLHRDVKPANILIDAFDNPGLADFGLAAVPEPGDDLAANIDALTPAYAPRETLHARPPTEFGDVYSLAATLYALLDGKPPRWPEKGTPSIPELLELQDKPIRRLPGVNKDLMDLLLKAMSDEPGARPTAAEFRDALAAIDFTETNPLKLALTAAKDSFTNAHQRPAALVGLPARTRKGSRAARFTVLGAILILLVAIVVAVINLRPRADPGIPAGPPGPTVAATLATATALPRASATRPKKPAPAGFTDCSAYFGDRNYCVTEPECWLGLISMADAPALGTLADCNKQHVYQTFAAGQLVDAVRLQSEFEVNKQVRALCSEKTLNALLTEGTVRKDWEIVPLPPQIQLKDTLFRCMVGFGEERTSVFQLKLPQ
jgi:tRNA A-37 threonylcarbamoyl transferase component Bud32